jgi:hypothetical protein
VACLKGGRTFGTPDLHAQIDAIDPDSPADRACGHGVHRCASACATLAPVAPDDYNETVLYEVDYAADAEIVAPFDTWLRDHTADVLQFDGFLSAEILDDDAEAPPGRVRRIVQYRLRNRAALEAYLRDHAPRLRQQGVEKFGDRYSVQRRVLAHREEFVRGAFSTENCLNCGEVLRGQHCSHCGQRAKVRVLSLGTLLRDLVGDLTNFDSRIWRTLKPLAFRPGKLTVEYLQGRRTHYSPPFRMYLILSLAFFLLTTLGENPGDAINFNLDGDGGANVQITPPTQESAPAEATPAEAAPAAGTAAPRSTPPLDSGRQHVVDAIVKRLPASEQARVRAELEQDLGSIPDEQLQPVEKMLGDPCSPDNLNISLGPSAERYEEQLRGACRKIMADSKSFGRAVYDNIPKMMFIFLPLIAAVMFVLYLGSGRYYVEHLLFFVHYHSFFFLCGLGAVLLDRLSNAFAGTDGGSPLDAAQGIFALVLFAYVPYYLFRAMRRVYGQGRVVTLLKFSLLSLGYLFFMTLTAIGLVLYTALTL